MAQNIQTVGELANYVDRVAGAVAALSAFVIKLPGLSETDREAVLALAHKLSPDPIPKQFTVGGPKQSATEKVEQIYREANL